METGGISSPSFRFFDVPDDGTTHVHRLSRDVITFSRSGGMARQVLQRVPASAQQPVLDFTRLAAKQTG